MCEGRGVVVVLVVRGDSCCEMATMNTCLRLLLSINRKND